MSKSWFKNLGPGTLVAAAFIGPGTVTLCTLAGVQFGFHLLWAMALSIVATIILQEMAARVGIISQKGLSEVIRLEIQHPLLRVLVLFLILMAIVIGNASYEAGNISGGILGLETLLGPLEFDVLNRSWNAYSWVVGLIAFVILFFGNYKRIERALLALVVLMSLSFVITAILTQPNLLEVLKGLVLPKAPKGSLLTIIGLIGTTIVPYNLFLHASLVKEKWSQETDLKDARKDTILSIALGGIVSMAIMISAASMPFEEIRNAQDLAKSLAPLYGSFAQYFLALGLFAAGITSAITAPLAAAYVVQGCFGGKSSLTSTRFRMVWMIILGLGVFFSSLGIKPIDIIKFAQVANGIVLPVIVGILVWIVNKKGVLGAYVNTRTQNIIGLLILLVSLFLGAKGVLSVFNVL